jgi:hypothetical protein
MSVTSTSNGRQVAVVCPVGGPAHRVQRVSSMALPRGSPLAMPQPPPQWLTTLALALVAPGVALAILFSRAPGAGNRVLGTAVAVLLTCGVPWWVLRARNRYQMALYRWRQLYYCQDCDGVFVPGGAPITPASGVRKLLYGRTQPGA